MSQKMSGSAVRGEATPSARGARVVRGRGGRGFHPAPLVYFGQQLIELYVKFYF
ncbi:MAG: hypothetical protein NZU63_10910 [Gemmataceae bacterium]|nr:hypothetical protein [Gemmataceae bacterium]MDW8244438.1 hypothetical protein [Thermogemmata sp.]